MRKLYYLVSVAAFATMVAAFAAPPSAQPISGMIGSWGYGGYGAFHMVLWVHILIAFIFGVLWRVWTAKHKHDVYSFEFVAAACDQRRDVRFKPECVAKLFAAMQSRNNRIQLNGALNQYWTLAFVLEPLLLVLTAKIVWQHNQPHSGHLQCTSASPLGPKADNLRALASRLFCATIGTSPLSGI
jgi:hypothetical protein